MPTDSPSLRWPALALAALVTGALGFASTGLDGWWPLVWLAPLPVLALAFRASARQAAAMAFAAWALNGLNLFTFMLRLTPPPIAVAVVLVPALAFALCVLAARRAVRRLPPGAAVFAFPLAWTAIEFLLSLPSPHGTSGSLAYTQSDVLPLIQIASVTGLPGITFLLTLAPSALAVAWQERADRRRAVQALAGPFAILVLALSWGGLRLAQPAGHPPVRVGLAATDATVASFHTEDPAEALPVVRAYARRVADLAHQGAVVVVLPEKFVGVTPAYEEEVDRIFSETARENRISVIAGLNRIGRPVAHNTAVAYSPAGQIVARYEKIHLLPAFEGQYPPGPGPTDLPLAGTQAGIAICKDMDFSALGRSHGQAGAGLVFVPAWDFVRDGRLHARMAVLRGVESGFAVVRTAQQGRLTVSDDRGRILAEATSSPAGTSLLAEVRPGSGPTFYSRTGDWFGWLTVAGLALVLVLSLRRDRRP